MINLEVKTTGHELAVAAGTGTHLQKQVGKRGEVGRHLDRGAAGREAGRQTHRHGQL